MSSCFAIWTYRRESARQPPAGTTKRVSPLAILVKYPQTCDPWCLRFTGAKCEKEFGQNFDHNRLRTTVFFERRRFTGKQKQTRQGPMIGLPAYKTLVGGSPQLPEPLAQWVPIRVKVENFLYILRSSGPSPAGARQYYTNNGAPTVLINYPQTFVPCCPPFTRGNVPNFALNYDSTTYTSLFTEMGSTKCEIR